MAKKLPDADRKSLRWLNFKWPLLWGLNLTLVLGVFFLGLFFVKHNKFIQSLLNPLSKNYEVFAFAPYWKLDAMDKVDWDALTTFAYFSLPVLADGSVDKNSYEWNVFEGDKLEALYKKAEENDVKKVITLTMMESADIESFLSDPKAWEKMTYETAAIVNEKDLDGVNIDFEYIPANSYLKNRFSQFVEVFSKIINEKANDPYVTVSVLASSVRFEKIYDIEKIAKNTDGVFMMAYDFYYPGSDGVGPSAPLYGYNGGKGPFWYDVSTAVEDFLKVTTADKIIMGVPLYGWNYPTASPSPNSVRTPWLRAFATTNEKAQNDEQIAAAPVWGWDSNAQVSWKSYQNENGWHVVYLEDEKSLSIKFDFAKSKNLAGVGIWALGYDGGNMTFWNLLAEAFGNKLLANSLKMNI